MARKKYLENYLGSRNYDSDLDSNAFNNPEIVDPPELSDPRRFFIGDSNNRITSPIKSSFDFNDFSVSNWSSPKNTSLSI